MNEQAILDLQKKAHQEWLNHPVTKDALKLLHARYIKHKVDLEFSILEKSDPPSQDAMRVAMKTCEANKKIIFNTDTFVELINKQTT